MTTNGDASPHGSRNYRDTARVYRASDGTVAAAVVDGAGNSAVLADLGTTTVHITPSKAVACPHGTTPAANENDAAAAVTSTVPNQSAVPAGSAAGSGMRCGEFGTSRRVVPGRPFGASPMLGPAGGPWNRAASGVDEPFRTRATRDTDAPVVPVQGREHLTARSVGQPARAQSALAQDALVVALPNHGVARPAGLAPAATVGAAGNHHVLVIRDNTGRAEMSTPITEPARTITTAGHQSLVRGDHLLVPYRRTGGQGIVNVHPARRDRIVIDSEPFIAVTSNGRVARRSTRHRLRPENGQVARQQDGVGDTKVATGAVDTSRNLTARGGPGRYCTAFLPLPAARLVTPRRGRAQHPCTKSPVSGLTVCSHRRRVLLVSTRANCLQGSVIKPIVDAGQTNRRPCRSTEIGS